MLWACLITAWIVGPLGLIVGLRWGRISAVYRLRWRERRQARAAR